MRQMLIALLLCLASHSIHAWNGAGHRIVAAIAWEKMSDAARAEATGLLAAHPDYARWTTSQPEADLARQAFLEASTWPDDIRNDPRFYDEQRDQTIAAPPGFSDNQRHRNWHYVDFSEEGHRQGDGELDAQLIRLSGKLRQSRLPLSKRAYALPWLIHLVGDIHQPLHVGRKSDEGGNLHPIEDPEHPRLPVSNLHRWWDDLPGPPWLRGRFLEQSVARLLGSHPPPEQGDPLFWREESRHLTATQVYPPVSGLTPDYRTAARRLAEQRLVAAGWRLGRWLNLLLNPVSRETASQ